jgi:hypothetical protein
MSLTKATYSMIDGASFNVFDYGATGDGVTNDTTAIANAISAAGSDGVVYFPSRTYVVTDLEMPQHTTGVFNVTGNIKWSNKRYATQTGRITVTGDVLMTGVWNCKFDYIDCGSGSFTIDGYETVRGSYWNDFGYIKGNAFVIDVDKGSVNQNLFTTMRFGGGVHIQGVATTGFREAHGNMFYSVDTTGSDLTAADGTTGVHLLNDSDQNQSNTVVAWYAEGSGRRLAYGAWNILGSTVDAANNPYMIGRKNSSLVAGVAQRNGSFFAHSQNISRGGDWSELRGDGQPISAYASAAGSVVVTTDAPDGNRSGLKQTGGGTFRALKIDYPLGTTAYVRASAFVYQEGTPTTSVDIVDSAGAILQSGAGIYTPLGNGWYLLRIAGISRVRNEGAGLTTGTINIYTTTSSALTAADFRVLGSFNVTNEETVSLPLAKTGQRVGFSTAPPAAGTWSAGDICWNTTPSSGGTPGWVCVTAGTPGTWKAMANLAA